MAAIGEGARLAERRFTLRAVLTAHRLVQAEAVADLIEAVTPRQARAAFDQLEGTLTERIAGIDSELFDLTARLEASLDFPDEGYHFVEAGEAGAALRSIERKLVALLCDARRGRLIREGARVAIIGKPNVGKSSLFKRAWLGAGRGDSDAVSRHARDLVSDALRSTASASSSSTTAACVRRATRSRARGSRGAVSRGPPPI